VTRLTDIPRKTYVLAQLFLEREMFQTDGVKEIKTRILFSIFFSQQSNIYDILWKNIAEARQDTYDNIIWRMRFACWISMATDAHNM